MGDVIKEWMENPDNRVNVFLAVNIGMILVNFLVAVGALVFVLRLLEYI